MKDWDMDHFALLWQSYDLSTSIQILISFKIVHVIPNVTSLKWEWRIRENQLKKSRKRK